MDNKTSFPKYLSIQTTSMCNASCTFCPYKDIDNLFPNKVMSMPLYEKIIDECSKHKEIERIILYMNNEPLTDPHIIERIDYAKQKLPWANVHILTNGLLLTDEMSDKLLKSRLDWIGISFHGIRKDTIEKTMGINYDIAFERINSFINKVNVHKNLKDYLMLTLIKHRHLTLDEKKESEDYWRSKGIERLSSFDGPISRAGNVRNLPKVYHKEKIVGCGSIWADEMIHIVEDGKVVLCCMDWRREVILGDLNKENIFEIWNKKRKEAWAIISGKTTMPNKFLCRNCEESILKKTIESKVVLILLPPWGVDTPPLGIACLSASLKHAGIPVQVFDVNIELYNIVSRQHKYLWHMNYASWWRTTKKYIDIRKELDAYIEPLIKKIVNLPQRIVAFSLPTNCSDLLLEEIVRRVKELDPEKVIILGGVSVSIREQRMALVSRVESFIDYCVIGEGEDAICELADKIFNNKMDEISQLKGVIQARNFENSKEGVRVEDLDVLPFPDFDEFDLTKYKVLTNLPMEFSRGCIGNCPFCGFRSISPIFRSKQASYIFNQLKFYKDRYNVNHVTLCDAAVNGDMKVLEDVCDLIIKNNFSINISALAIARKEMTLDLLKKMRRAGFYRLEYGIESGSNKILKAMRKIFTQEIASKVLTDTYEAGIKTYVYFMVGYPQETEYDFNETKEFLKKNARYITAIRSINPLYIMAGSELFCNFQKYDISFPIHDRDREWFIGDENTFAVRKQRVLELKNLAIEQEVSFSEEAEALECTLNSLNKKNSREHPDNKNIETSSCNVAKTDILLVICPPWGHEMPPSGIAYLATFLKQKGFKVEIFDFNIDVYQKSSGKVRELWKIESLRCWQDKDLFPEILNLFNNKIDYCVEKLLNSDSQFIGFSVNEANITLTIEVVKRLKHKRPDKIVIFGGPGCYWPYYKDQNLPSGVYDYETDRLRITPGLIDIFVRGEGEITLLDVLTAYKESLSKAIPGTIIFEKGRYVNHGLREPVKHLDDLPYPTLEEFALDKYSQVTVPLLSSRGCVNKCNFCNDHVMSVRYRTRTAKHIVSEILFHHEKGARNFFFCDLLINGSLYQLKELCELIIKSNIDVHWTAQAAIRKGMDYDLLSKLRRSGCGSLVYGIESFSDNVLRRMNKTYTSNDAIKQLKVTKSVGIKTLMNVILGFPGESNDDFEATKEIFKKVCMHVDEVSSVQTCHLTPGSDIDINPEKYGIIRPLKEGWFKWHAGVVNNYSVREQRLREFVRLIKDVKKKLLLTNLYEEKLEQERKILKVECREKSQIDVLLIMCPPWGQEMPPLGLAYLYACLKSKGRNCIVWDINIEMYDAAINEEKNLWLMQSYLSWNDKELFKDEILARFDSKIAFYLDKLHSLDVKVIGFSVNAANLLFTQEMAKRIKEEDSDKIIVFGGPHCSWINLSAFNLGIDLDPGIVDIFVLGEGEHAISEIVDRAKQKKGLEDIAGTVFYKDGSYFLGKERQLIADLDSIPFPELDVFPLEKYSSAAIPILMSRGCIRRCRFCNDTFIIKQYRCRNAANVFEEMKYRMQGKQTGYFQFNDLLVNGNIKELEKLCQLIINAKIRITWSGQGAIRNDMTLRLLKLMRKAGFLSITYGVESFSDNVLKAMNKPYTSEDAKRILKLTKDAGIAAYINVVTGFPGENSAEFNETVNSIKEVRPNIAGIASLAPCLITYGSDLQMNLDKFKIIYPKKEGYFRWYIQNGNNYELRKSRTKEILATIKELNLTCGIVNLYDETTIQEPEEKVLVNDSTSTSCDFLLVNLPPWAQENPHIGIGYLSAYLRNKGIKAEVLDLNKSFFLGHPDFGMLWHVENKSFWSNEDTFLLILEIFKKDIEDAVGKILSHDCNTLGFSAIDPKERLTIEFIKMIKRKAPDKRIVLGGPATSTPEQRKIFLDNIDNHIDAFVVGEGEETLLDLINRFKSKKDLKDVTGCFVKNDGKWVYKKRKAISPLDKAPFPTYEEFDMNLYGKSLLVEWSRGCMAKCAFCKNWRLSSFYRNRSADKVLNELIYHKQNNGISDFTVTDNILNGDLINLDKVCDKIIEKNLNISWTGQIAPRKDMHYELFRKMRQAGCYKLQIGLESASNKVLKLMRKTFTSDISENNIRFAKKAGIEVEVFVIIGFPGEAKDDFKKTYNFIKRNSAHIDTIKSINTLHLVAGTEVFEKGKENFGMKPLPKDNWHYLWETYSGNTYEIRKKRAEKLLDLAADLKIRVMETNIGEGKERNLGIGKEEDDLNEKILLFKKSINSLQELPQEKIRITKRRSIFKWFILILVSIYTFFYIVYFWIYMILRNRVLLGGKRK